MKERLYPELLGPLNGGLEIWVECLFADPVSDIAILGEPDGQVLFEQATAYDEMTEDVGLMPGEAENGSGFVLSLENEWKPVEMRTFARHVSLTSGVVRNGMSGSPIVQDGRAVGVVTLGGLSNPLLNMCLPGWMLRSA